MKDSFQINDPSRTDSAFSQSDEPWRDYGQVNERNQPAPRTVPDGIPLRDAYTRAQEPQNNEVLIITGYSGAGRTGAARALEDLDWYVVDNLPPQMLPALVGMMAPAGAGVHRLAVVIDVRSRAFFTELINTVEQLTETGVPHRILFLEADTATLVRRYESNRRPHPMQGNGMLLDGIHAEARLLAPLRSRADEVIDTTHMNVHDLSRHVRDVIAAEGNRPLKVTVESFGFKRGIPLDADHVLDVRFLKNPYWVDELRHLTGRDEAVANYVLNQPGALAFAKGYANLLAPMLNGYLVELKPFTTIAVGCTGGKHRSVAVSECIAAVLRDKGFSVRVVHRDLGRE
ncbi:RNase adapter RapZ [Schaalia sp. lx-260]|uniref:RNase adapter RapZ n=1 Tax=Schaalia sp. lx-260 TaxID=2899082 RepID=UPI001E3FD76A|nr:RNase adapter RapZ [Schaalia sp. lx-260]MCD4549360.1 RNase adapter RapZ [Schaalia sp. lx-260]